MMGAQPSEIRDFLNNAQREQHERAKLWWYSSKIAQLLVLVVSVTMSIWSVIPTALALLVTLISLFAVVAQWISDTRKGIAQAIHRKFEFLDALGWPVSMTELRNLHVALPKAMKERLDQNPTPPFEYYDSGSTPSPRRMIENLSETAYFSQHLAARAAQISGAISVAVVGIAVLMLIVALQSAPTQAVSVTIAKVVTSVIVFLFTAGFLRLAWDYYCFSQKAVQIEEIACRLLDHDEIVEVEAIKLFHEYQIARASSPLLPTWIWQSMRDELNQRWRQYNQKGTSLA